VAAASVLLPGLSGWFTAAAALAGAAGPIAAQAFNYLLPSAAIRLLAIVRTGARYGERLASHGAAFGALARLRPALFRAIAAAPLRRRPKRWGRARRPPGSSATWMRSRCALSASRGRGAWARRSSPTWR
jgi:ABC-type transport system involved in cytochrome bd biosynthesis fused ATPase/permease subunit